jgi:hypothetical protein
MATKVFQINGVSGHIYLNDGKVGWALDLVVDDLFFMFFDKVDGLLWIVKRFGEKGCLAFNGLELTKIDEQ